REDSGGRMQPGSSEMRNVARFFARNIVFLAPFFLGAILLLPQTGWAQSQLTGGLTPEQVLQLRNSANAAVPAVPELPSNTVLVHQGQTFGNMQEAPPPPPSRLEQIMSMRAGAKLRLF